MIRNNSTTQPPAGQLVKANLEMILPCNEMQQAFYLLNQQSQPDPGVIVAEAELSGPLDFELFTECWTLELARHETLRMSVRPKKDETPMIVIWKNLIQEIEFIDGEHGLDFEQTKLELSSNIRLDVPPVSKLALVQQAPNRHKLLWAFHHLFMDGWSTSIVLRDVVNRYSARSLDETNYRAPTKPSYAQFHRSREQLDYWSAREYWSGELDGFEGCPVLAKNRNGFQSGDSISNELTLTELDSTRISDLIRENGLTSAAIASAAWSLVLHDLYGRDDIGFGMTVSGRNMALEGIHNFVGMLANVVPYRSRIDESASAAPSKVDWLRGILDSQFRSRQHEHLPLSAIFDLYDSKPGTLLLETLLVVENFFQAGTPDRPLQINQFSSGAASGFPVTCFVIPGAKWKVRVDVKEVCHAEELASRLAGNLSAILSALPTARDVVDLANLLRRANVNELSTEKGRDEDELALGVEFTPTEIRLAEVWETMLGVVQVLPEDNFFALGGKSLTAVRICNAIKTEFGIDVAPSALIEHPTIRQLAKMIADGGEIENSDVLRFNQVGSQEILICIHYGIGYASYFRHLAREFPDFDVIGVQSKGMADGDAATSFEQLAEYLSDRLDSLVSGKRIQIAGYCMSAKFSLALANELVRRGHQVANLMAIDSGPDFPTQPQTLSEFLRRTKSPVWAFCRYAKRKTIYLKMWFKFLIARMAGNTEFLASYNGELVRRKSIQAFLDYEMHPTQIPFSLIRSSEYSNLPEKKFHMEWRNWAEDFRYCIIEGEHKLLLLEPAVKRLARIIRSIMSEDRYSDNSTIWRN